MGGTIDEEVRGTPHGALPYSHAAGYTAFERTTIVAGADVVEEKAQHPYATNGTSRNTILTIKR